MGMWHRLTNLLRRERVDAEIDEELRAHLEMAVEDGTRAGMSDEEARRAARLRFGNPVTMREQTAGADVALSLDGMWRDVRYALRQLKRSPGFAVTAVLTLALGIGATTAIFSIVEGVLLRPLPYQHPERLVVVWQSSAEHRTTGEYFSTYREFEAWQQNSRSFEKLAALSWATGVSSSPVLWRGQPVDMLAIPVSMDFFPMLGVSAQMGRTFSQADLNNNCTLVLSHAFWQEKLGGARDVVGQSLSTEDSNCLVVGVMAKSFSFYPAKTAAWKLITPGSEFAKKPWSAMAGVFGLLKPGVTREAAAAELQAIQTPVVAEAPADEGIFRKLAPVVIGLQDNFTWLTGRNLRRGLWLLLGASSLILLMACVNVGNLLLGRSIERARELAVRAALGAGRARLVSQLMAESLLLAACGTAAGMALAMGLLQWFRAASPVELPPGSTITMDWCVLGFTAGVGIAALLMFGLLPAWRGSGTDPNTVLKAYGWAQGHTVSAQRTTRTLVVAQVALSMLLLAVAGLLAESLWKLMATDLGYRTEDVFTAQVQLPAHRYPDASTRSRFAAELTGSLGSLPGVRAVGLGSRYLPMGPTDSLSVEGRAESKEATADVTELDVNAGYFAALGIPLLQGRLFDSGDHSKAPEVAIINEAAAKRYFPGMNPLGHSIKLGRADDGKLPWLTIAGVVSNVKTMTVFQEMGYVETPAVYRPIAQTGPPSLALMIAVNGKTADLASEVEQRLSAIDRGLVLEDIGGMQAMRSADLSQPQFRTMLFGGFAMLALALALVGLYGVLSQMIVRRRRDIGVRMALGADRERILRSIVLQACAMTVTGIVIGAAGAVATMRLLHELLYGIHAKGAGEMAAAGAAMLVVTIAAALIPARRAAGLDPVETLRAE